MLYLVATPIGNLGDITFRAVEVLKACEYILCEDTRHSLPLLRHYGIQKPLKSYHKFSEASKLQNVLDDLKSGKTIALISDAGTPGISDPGSMLVQNSIKEGIRVESIPGPCAAIAALTCSGLNTDRFQFFGFLPRKAGELQKALQDILSYPGTTICYESPQRILKVLQVLQETAPERILSIARELTKKFEEIRRGTAQELIHYWKAHTLKGEIVVMISGRTEPQSQDWSHLSPPEHVQYLEETYGMSRKDAIKMAAEQRGVPKRDIYKMTHQDDACR